MISYKPLWDTLARKNMSTYDLIYRQGLSSNTIYRIKHGKDITTKTINDLCEILDCTVSEILEFQQSVEH